MLTPVLPGFLLTMSLNTLTIVKEGEFFMIATRYDGSIWPRGGWVVRWCWVNFQCRGVLLIWLIVGQGPTALAVGAGGGCLDIFTIIYLFSPLSPSLLGDGTI